MPLPLLAGAAAGGYSGYRLREWLTGGSSETAAMKTAVSQAYAAENAPPQPFGLGDKILLTATGLGVLWIVAKYVVK